MRVKTLLEMLSKYAPEDNLCVLYWDKDCFDYSPDDESELTTERWDEICDEFDEWPDAGQDVGEWIADAVAEKATEKVKGNMVIFDESTDYEEWCKALGRDPEDDENYNAFSEWIANSF